MDAQNAVESTSAKQPASPKRGVDNETSQARTRSPVASKPPPSITKETKPATATSTAPDEDAAHERDSDAETIVLSGKDGVSPSKPRKVIKHEDNSDGEINDVVPAPKKLPKEGKESAKDADRSTGPTDDSASSLGKKKRPLDKPRTRDGSTGLSSAPTSPPSHHHRELLSSHRRRRSGGAGSGSDSETSKPTSPKLSKEKAKSVDRLLSQKRKAHRAESDDETEPRKVRRPRISETSVDGKLSKDHKSSSAKSHPDRQSLSRPRSVSPHGRTHRRSLSTQLSEKSSAFGVGPKKRRVPAPLQATDYHSDDSSAGGSPHPRSSRLKSIVTPGTGDSTMSPLKMVPHKKHLDAHGQTLFAKACAKGEYEVAKTRLAERPEDLNFADHAGNTPLQVASLNGHEDVVELLIGAGCHLECRNDVKDTPLLDAVENGHLGVVKLLLAAGVNPRKANAEGQEPLEKIPDDLDNAEEIRQALLEAKQRVGELRRTSEDHLPHDSQDNSSHGANSPHRSPEPSIGAVLAASSRRGGTVRSTKTSNHLLYMSLDEKTLRQAAARGDHETVTRILQVKESCDDAEALVAAARGGHNFVMELLLALGGANPDPSPVHSLPSEHSTPMLAAIGQENIKVVQLLLEQSGFDPTRRFRGETYYEIARRREGSMWKEEEHMLKNAYDEYKKAHRGSSKSKSSPSRRERELAQEAKRIARAETNQDKARLQHKRRPSSPPRDSDPKKKTGPNKVVGSPREKRRSRSFGQNDEQQTSPKRGRPKKEEKLPTIAISDREASPALSAKAHPAKTKRTESDIAGSSEGEASKPRRKLISGKDLKGQREKQRRASMVSNNSTKDAPERNDSKPADSAAEKPRSDHITEKYHDRTKALKRDDSRDRLSPNDASGKRHRASMTPPRHSADDKDDSEAPLKRRKLDADGKENRTTKTTSSDDRPRKRDPSRDPAKRQKPSENDRKDGLKVKKLNRERKEGDKPSSSEKPNITVVSGDVDMQDAPEVASIEDREVLSEKERADAKKRQVESEAAAAEEARKKAEAKQREEKQKREAEDKRLKEEAEKKRVEEEEKQQREETERKRQEEEEKAKLEAERQKHEEEEKRKREEEERQKKEKEEEEERVRREEEERTRREKEAAEEARRQREEDERRELQRKRAARDAELLRLRQEQEREQEKIRLSKLPPLLRWLDACPDPKQKEYAELFTIMQGVRYDTINTQATGTQGREQWLLNTQVALLLGEKDLTLQRYTGWERIPVSNIAKRVIWRLEQDRYALTESKLYHLGEQLPNYYGGDPNKVGYRRLEKLRGDASKLFFDMDMFFVKESDLLFVLPSIPHLRNVKLSISYRELPEHENQLNFWTVPAKWKSDPDASTREGFAPRQKYYINGRLDSEDRPGHYKPRSSPFPDQRVPRRGGLVAVGPEEPDFPQLCLEQGLGHLLSEQQKLLAMNAAHLTPRSMTSNDEADGVNGENMSPSAVSPTTRVNGVYSKETSEPPLVNGINGTAH